MSIFAEMLKITVKAALKIFQDILLEVHNDGGFRRDQQLEAHAPPPPLQSPNDKRTGPDDDPEPSSSANPPEGKLPTLPTEIILEILSRLPVKPLLRFKCVSKSWKSLISSSDFVKKHLQFAKREAEFDRCELILCCWTGQARTLIRSCCVSSLLNSRSVVNPVELHSPLKKGREIHSIIGCCDGLVCISIWREISTVVLWNPCTRATREVSLRVASQLSPIFGFGYDSSSDDYKVVAFGFFLSEGGEEKYEYGVEVFSVRGNTWKRIQGRRYTPCDYYDVLTFVGGAVNWITQKDVGSKISLVIMSLDFASETYKEVLLPPYGDSIVECMGLGVLGECLCFVCLDFHTVVDMWVMKEYGVRESWTRLATFEYGYTIDFAKPLGLTQKGEILIQFDRELALYNPKENTDECLEIEGVDDLRLADLHVDTLISPSVED